MSDQPAASTHVNVLGPLTVVTADGTVDLGGRKPRLLLALLVAGAGDVVTSESLIDGLWGDDPPATARKTLQVHVSNLRRSLGEGFPLDTTRAGYRVRVDQVVIDAEMFQAELRSAESIRRDDPAGASTILTTALGRWTGAPYAELADEDAIVPEATRLNELRLRAIELRIDADLQLDRHDMVVSELEALTTDHPYHERLRELHMLALYRSGRQADALRVFDRARRALADDLGLDPGPGLRRLHQHVLEQNPALTPSREEAASTPGTATMLATPAASVLEPDVGVTIRGYELRERLGTRGDAAVFRAYQAAVGREVALRCIPPISSDQPDFVKRFESDCRLLACLEHPHIVRVHDFWRDAVGAFVVMQLMRGGTLEHSLANGLWLPHATVRMVDQVGDALAYAHRRGIVHGDLRASNVLLDDSANAYVADFRPRAAGGGVDPATDIAALGELTCRTLTGIAPADLPFGRVDVPVVFQEVIRRATDPDPTHRYERVDDFVRAIRQCFGADVVSGRTVTPRRDVRNPYKGLRAFQESDAADFFGRSELLAELVERVSTHALTAVVGPSGSGKSSLVRAGLVPSARRAGLADGRDLIVAEMFPGAYPFEELATALERVAVHRAVPRTGLAADLAADDRGLVRTAKLILPDDDTDLLLVIDQFEELFALTADEQVRRRFLDNLLAVAGDDAARVRVVVTLRADFFGQPLAYPEFGELMKASLVAVTLPDDDALAEAISEPARRVGLEIEPGLIPTILRDVADEPGALPMLQYALTELADQRDTDVLTIDGYERTGGVVGAVAARAEEIHAGLPSAAREVARQMFVRLVAVSDEADDTRRRVRRTELESLGVNRAALESVIDAYGASRLLSFDNDPVSRGPTVEVAHEALIREWPRLREWIDDQREDLRTERRLQSTVAEWRQGEHDPAFLISGGRLDQYEEWAAAAVTPLTDDERDFLHRSRREADQRESAAARRRRLVLATVSVLAVLALIAAAIAVVQRNRAEAQADEAEQLGAEAERQATELADLLEETERRGAIERSVALAGRALEQPDDDLRVLLALEAVAVLDDVGVDDPRVDGVLHRAVREHRVQHRIRFDGPRAPDRDVTVAVATGEPGAIALTSFAYRYVQVVDPTTGRSLGSFEPSTELTASIWDDASSTFFSGDLTGSIYQWRLPGVEIDRRELAPGVPVWPVMVHDGALWYLEFEPTGLSVTPTAVALDLATGRSERWDGIGWVRPSPDRRHLLSEEDDDTGGFVVYDTATMDPVTTIVSPVGADSSSADWAPNGDVQLLADGRLTRLDAETGDEIASFETSTLGDSFVEADPNSDLVVLVETAPSFRTTSRGEDRFVVFDTSRGEQVAEFTLRFDNPFEFLPATVRWLPGGRLVVGDAETLILSFSPTHDAAVLPDGIESPMLVVPDGDDAIAVADADGSVVVVADDGNIRHRHTAGAGRAVVDRNASMIAVPGDVAAELIDLASGDVRVRAPTAPSPHTRPLAVSPGGDRWIVGSSIDPDDRQRFVALVQGSDGELVGRVASEVDGTAAAYSSDGAWALVAVSNVRRFEDGPGRHNVWLVDGDSAVTESTYLVDDDECIADVAISSDDRLAALLGCEGTVTLLDVETLRSDEPWTADVGTARRRPVSDPEGTAELSVPGVGVVFGPDDEQLLATFEDGTLVAFGADPALPVHWELDLGVHAGIPTVHDDTLWVGASEGAAGSPDAAGLLVRIPLDLDELVALANDTVTRRLTDAECREFLGRTSCSTA